MKGCLVSILFVALLGIVSGSAAGYTSNAKVTNGITDLIKLGKDFTKEMNAMSKLTYDVLKDMDQNPNSALVKLTADIKKTVDDAGKKVDDSNNARAMVAYIFYGVFIVIPFLGFAAYFFQSPKLSMSMAVVSWLVSALTWLLFGLSFLMAVYLDDSCVEIGKFTAGKPSKISEVFKCPAVAEFETAYKSNVDLVTPSIKNFNSVHGSKASKLPLPGGPVYPDLAKPAKAPYAFVQNTKYLYQLTLSIPVVPCKTKTSKGSQIEYCKVKGAAETKPPCKLTGSSGSPYDKRTVCHQQQIIAAASGMVGASYVANCQYLKGLTVKLNNDVCYNMVAGFTGVFVAQALIGVMYIIVLVVGIKGLRAFASEEAGAAFKVTPDDSSGMEMQQHAGVAGMGAPPPLLKPEQYGSQHHHAATKIQSIQRGKQAKAKVQDQRAKKRAN